ncbi:hypothetical protein J437_LFUL000085 [Ladona fulva]|uniref:G2/mitotic-specific cyclin-B3 n=1 Tax=Ladona fulva TaxID=123851 RepID=A0A8K0K5G1_LADFU|nr:hypothetical protein J437_LFUL000085 [Ladona fulva]
MTSKKAAKLDQESSKQPFSYLRKGAGLRCRNGQPCNTQENSKRKANFSPKKDEPVKKPLLDLTNDTRKGNVLNIKGNTTKQPKLIVNKGKTGDENVMPKSMVTRQAKAVAAQPKPAQPKSTKYVPHPRAKLPQHYAPKSVPETASKTKASQGSGSAPHVGAEKRSEKPSSLDSSKSEENLLYVTALEDCTSEIVSEKAAEVDASFKTCDAAISPVASVSSCKQESKSLVPPNVEDFDGKTKNDPFEASCYAMDIFNYLKTREAFFSIDGSYLSRQIGLTVGMRALLVDWMVETQESFELNHETLYLAVKIVDLFLSRHQKVVRKEHLQLVGTTALLIASKYDERVPPTLDDFTYLCDEAYTKAELVAMEGIILKVIDFQLGLPLSYRFLRRYARSTKAPMDVLYLARYILEMSLMEYSLVSRSDSKMAAAALLLARIMKNLDESWNPALEYYTGYKVSDIKDLVHELNAMIHKTPRDGLMAVRSKYSHSLFYESAKVPLKDNIQL